MLLEFCFDPRGVPDQIEFIDLLVFTQRHNGASNEVRRAKVTAHRIEGDLHRCETLRAKTIDCKAKIAAASLRAWHQSPTWGRLLPFERQYLAPTVVAARRADDLRREGAAALCVFVERRSVPPDCVFPRADRHL